MAQPPLSKRLQELEEEVGAQLFERSGRTIRPTSAGYHLYQRAGAILREVEDAAKETALIAKRRAKVLRIGLTHLYQNYFSRMLLELHRANPDLELVITVSDSGHLERLLCSRSIDVAMMQRPQEAAGFDFIDLVPVKMVGVASSALGLVANRDMISQAELATYPLVLLKRAHGTGIYESLLEHFRKIGVTPHVTMCISQPEVILAWLEAGLEAIALLPASEVPLGRLFNCQVLQISNSPLIFFPTVAKLTTASFPQELSRVLENADDLVAH